MKPDLLSNRVKIEIPVIKDNIPGFSTGDGKTLNDSQLKAEDLKKQLQTMPSVEDHINNADIHVTKTDKALWNQRPDVSAHVMNADIHVSAVDRANWDSKETEDGAQWKANIVQTNLNKHQTNNDIHITADERKHWNNVYSKEDINAIIAQMEFQIDWKESVNTFADIAKTYPEPYDGWTVNVLDTDVTYRFDGDNWIAISANTIPNATQSVDGKMSKEDKTKLDGIEEHANKYVHPNDQYTRHVTDLQIKFWSNKASVSEVNYSIAGLMSVADKKKLDGVEEFATHYEHPTTHPSRMIETSDNMQFVSKTQIVAWNSKASNTTATEYVKGLMSPPDKVKLDGVEAHANAYVHPKSHDASMITETETRVFCTPDEKKTWNEKYGPKNIIRGSGIFNGMDGSRILHEINDPTMSYTVMILPTSINDLKGIGQIAIIKQATEAYVYASGGNVSDTFDYFIFRD